MAGVDFHRLLKVLLYVANSHSHLKGADAPNWLRDVRSALADAGWGMGERS